MSKQTIQESARCVLDEINAVLGGYQPFLLQGTYDENGIQTVTVGHGIIFPDGRCALHWLSTNDFTVVYDSIQAIKNSYGDRYSIVPFNMTIRKEKSNEGE